MPIERAYGCVFCVTGRERTVAESIQSACPDVRAYAVFQEKYQSKDGKKRRIETVILPGYVFFNAPVDAEIFVRFPKADVIRVLKGNERDWRLTGEDREFARRVFDYEGCIGFSKAYLDGDRVRILSGPLKDMEGMITRIDRRGKSGQVAMNFNGREVKLWLGFELVESVPPEGGGEEFQKNSEECNGNGSS